MIEAAGLISNVGFPIGAFVLMWRLVTRTLEDLTEALDAQSRELRALRREVGLRTDGGEDSE